MNLCSKIQHAREPEHLALLHDGLGDGGVSIDDLQQPWGALAHTYSISDEAAACSSRACSPLGGAWTILSAQAASGWI